MRVIIDGYNLLHAARSSHWGDESIGRSHLCRVLGAWASDNGHRVTILFDGSVRNAALAEQLGDPRIEVLQSGGQIADEQIAELLRQYSGARDSLVVSSDHEVQRSARQRNASFVDSDVFFERVHTELRSARRRSAEPEEKGEGVAEETRNDWLIEFGFDPGHGEAFEHP